MGANVNAMVFRVRSASPANALAISWNYGTWGKNAVNVSVGERSNTNVTFIIEYNNPQDQPVFVMKNKSTESVGLTITNTRLKDAVTSCNESFVNGILVNVTC